MQNIGYISANLFANPSEDDVVDSPSSAAAPVVCGEMACSCKLCYNRRMGNV